MKTSVMNPDKIARSAVRNFAPYTAGRDLESVQKEYGLTRVVKLASNENPLGAGRAAVEAVKKSAAGVFRYPDSDSSALRRAAGKKLNFDPDGIIAGAGSDELIEIVAKAFFETGDEVVVSAHAFIRYKMAAELMAAKTVEVPARDYGHDLAAMASAVNSRTKAVFIANPNNPTGTYNTRRQFEDFLAALAKKRRAPLVIADEAYFEYARPLRDYPDASDYIIAKNPNLIVLRTFSKIHGLAGLRAGLALCDRKIAAHLNRLRPPFNVSSVAQAAAAAAVSDDAHVAESLKIFREGRDYLYEELAEIGVRFLKTAGNFILAEARPFAGREIFRRLLERGVIVRAMDEYNLPGHFRVTVGLPAENRIFVRELKKIMSGRKTA